MNGLTNTENLVCSPVFARKPSVFLLDRIISIRVEVVMKDSKFRKKLLKEYIKIKDRVEQSGGSIAILPSVKIHSGDLLMEVKDSDCGFIEWLKSNFSCTVEIGSGRNHLSSVNGKPKVDYNSLKTAKAAANRMEKKTGDTFSAYKCPECKGFHIGKD